VKASLVVWHGLMKGPIQVEWHYGLAEIHVVKI
jgi:hypothetical protein